ncbi:MAG TPA: CBS domain-containing protein [Polyangiaceae bacterium]|nr:CBS domain-containing protein [Polyangiaceae bacterium]
MRVSEIMTRDVDVVSPEATLFEAAALMARDDVGVLPIGHERKLAGILTDRDIVVRGVAHGKNPATTPVKDVMTPELIFVFEDQDVQQAAFLMSSRQVRRLPVLDRRHCLVGIVSLGDLAQHDDDEERLSVTLQSVSEPT